MNENNNSLQPVVLGELKKQKSSKPLLVFLIFFIIITVTILIPLIDDSLSDPDTPLGALYQKIFNKEDIDEGNEDDIDEENNINRVILNEDTFISFEDITISNITLEGNFIRYFVKYDNEENNILDYTPYYIEVFDKEDNFVTNVKLIGIVTDDGLTMNISLPEVEFNSNEDYYGKVIKLTEFEDITMFVDNDGYSSITCTKFQNTLKYQFKDGLLKRVEHKFVNNNIDNIDAYILSLHFQKEKADYLNSLDEGSTIVKETDVGFEIIANLDLTKVDTYTLGDYLVFTYYRLDEDARKVHYEMKAKGYDCK